MRRMRTRVLRDRSRRTEEASALEEEHRKIPDSPAFQRVMAALGDLLLSESGQAGLMIFFGEPQE